MIIMVVVRGVRARHVVRAESGRMARAVLAAVVRMVPGAMVAVWAESLALDLVGSLGEHRNVTIAAVVV